MRITYLKPTNYRTMRWKSGNGLTAEIVISPDHASLQENNFNWRLSSANFSEDGHFSIFTGYRRYLSLIDGSKVTLNFKESTKILNLNEVIEFRGEENVFCEVHKQSIQDLNFIFNPQTIKARFDIFSTPVKTQLQGFEEQIFFVNSGAMLINVNSQKYHLANLETLLVTLADGEVANIETDSQHVSFASIKITHLVQSDYGHDTTSKINGIGTINLKSEFVRKA